MRRIAHFSNPVNPAIHLSKNLLEKFSDNSLEHGAFLRSNGKVTKISVFPSNHLRVNFSESPPLRPSLAGRCRLRPDVLASEPGGLCGVPVLDFAGK